MALDAAIAKISSIYIKVLLAGNHTPELELSLRGLELELYELLDQLYKQQHLKDYMKYEAEVTRQLLIYSMLKRLLNIKSN
ncbi:CG34217 [Drosophila busckii]|uniref:CG34217 n=1 Tax=Drosophila busckii TaxID=30019 RepID=A0A0M4ED94_DROBS|nr:CG34217 [Drosophila busckii]